MSVTDVYPSTDAFGPMVSRGAVASAVINELSLPAVGNDGVTGQASRLTYYIAEAERQYGLTPRTIQVPSTLGYRVGVDFETYLEEQFPVIIVTAHPDGGPQALDTNKVIGQDFTVGIAAICNGPDEATATQTADIYGIAITNLIGQRGGLQGVATNTRFTVYPDVDFPDPDDRAIARCRMTFVTKVAPVLNFHYGPISFAFDQYATPGPTLPTVTLSSTSVTLTATEG